MLDPSTQQVVAGMMIYLMVTIMCYALCSDTTPSGRRIVPRAERWLSRLGDWLTKHSIGKDI